MKFRFTLMALVFAYSTLFAQVAKDQVLMLKAQNNGGTISLHWQGTEGFGGNYIVSSRMVGENIWNELTGTTDTFYTDNEMEVGKAYEFAVSKQQTGQTLALGYTMVGFNYTPSPLKGGALVLVDSLFMDALEEELNRFAEDLTLEGWDVNFLYAGRNEEVPVVKDRIVSAADANTEALVIIGHVPVPYSGNFTRFGIAPPDGHIEGSGNHTGAWAADAFYGDLDGSWTDNSANHVDAQLDRGNNIPGDGKYDQSKLPSPVELQVGRIDFWDMPAFGKTEEELLKDYLDRNHAYRTGEWMVEERALIDNNFRNFNLASTGYHSFSCFMEQDKIDDTADYVTAQRAGGYLWSYGCGAGSFTSCNGLFDGRAQTSDIAADTLHNVFTIIAGSFFGDWDIKDNFLRAPLCNQSLVSFWGGLPKWYVHHMAMGFNIGYGARLSMNNIDDYFNGGFNNSQNSIHIALMGDPTLNMKGLSRPTELSATSNGGAVDLSWTAASGEIDGYNVYRWDTSGVAIKINDVVITGTNYTDETNWFSGEFTYTVRAVKLDENPSGSYYITSGGPKTDVSHINNIEQAIEAQIQVFPSPANNTVTLTSNYTENMQVEIWSASGQLVLQTQLNGTKNIDITSFENGVYLVKCYNDQGVIGHSRFVKM